MAKDKNPILDLFTALISTALSSIFTSPTTRVKLLLQNQDASRLMTKETRYNGIIDCFTRVYREQGFLSFYRGNMIYVFEKVTHIP